VDDRTRKSIIACLDVYPVEQIKDALSDLREGRTDGRTWMNGKRLLGDYETPIQHGEDSPRSRIVRKVIGHAKAHFYNIRLGDTPENSPSCRSAVSVIEDWLSKRLSSSDP